MINTKQQRNKGKGKRLLIALLFLPIITIIASAFSGVRAALFGADTEQVADLILQSASLACIIGILLGALYIFVPKMTSAKWPIICTSAVLGIFPFAILYPWLPQKVLSYLAQSVKQPNLNDPKRLILVGALDGLIFGGVVGFLVGSIDSKASPLSRLSLVRYLVLSTLAASIIISSMVINESGKFGDFIATFLFIISVPVLKIVIWWWDRRQIAK